MVRYGLCVILMVAVVSGLDSTLNPGLSSTIQSGFDSSDEGSRADGMYAETSAAASEVSGEPAGSPESETVTPAGSLYPEQPESEGPLATDEPVSEFQEPDHSEYISTTTARWRDRSTNRGRCTGRSLITCNATNHERCYLDEGHPRCMCLTGYERDQHGKCLAVQYYEGRLPTFLTYTSDLDDQRADRYSDVVKRAGRALEKALQASRLLSIYLYSEIVDLVRDEGDDVTIVFDIVLPSSYAPKAYVVLSDVKHGIAQVLTPSGNNGYTIANSGIPILQRHLEALTITATDPCTSSRYNYCDETADCHATYPMGFVCSCRSGYEDISPDRRSNPGEVCKLSSCSCQNDGQCDVTDQGDTICRCRSWYFGRNCSIDGKVLFIAVNAVVGGLIVLALIVCCVCLKKMQQNENSKSIREKKMLDAAVSRDFPTVITYKMPSAWMDRWSHLPETNHRVDRWSHQSESNYRLNGKLNTAYDEPLSHHGMATFRRSDEYLSIPRPQLRSTGSEQATDRSRQDQNKEHWAWTLQ